MRLFINGTQVGSSSNASINNDFYSTFGIEVGRNGLGNGSNYFNGRMGAIRISHTARKPYEIFNYYKGADIKLE